MQACALSAYSANTTTDHVLGDNVSVFPAPSLAGQGGYLGGNVPAWRVSSSTSKTIYLKGLVNYGAGTLGTWTGRISARRVR